MATLPRTAGSAPPNFYTQVGGGMSSPTQGGGAPGAGQQTNPPGPGQQPGAQQATPKPDQDFLDSTVKLLTVLEKLGQMKPAGVDISKFTDAMATTLKACQEFVSSKGKGAGKGGNTPGTSAGDMGTGGNDAAAGSAAGTTGVASASNATGTV